MKRLSLFITLIALIGFSATAQQSEMLPKKAQVQTPKRMAGKEFPAMPASTRDVDTLVWFSNIQPCDTGAVAMWYFSAPHDWLTGHNAFIDSAKAEHYSGITGDKIVGLWAFFGDATYTNTATQKCHLRVWDDNGVDGSPGTRLASVDITHAKIAVDVAAGNITQVFFATPLTLPAGGNFYAGVELDYKLKQGIPTWDSTRTVGLYNTAPFWMEIPLVVIACLILHGRNGVMEHGIHTTRSILSTLMDPFWVSATTFSLLLQLNQDVQASVLTHPQLQSAKENL